MLAAIIINSIPTTTTIMLKPTIDIVNLMMNENKKKAKTTKKNCEENTKIKKNVLTTGFTLNRGEK